MNKKDAEKRVQGKLIEQKLIHMEANKRITEVPDEEVESEFVKLVSHYGGEESFYQRFNMTPNDKEQVKKDLEQNVRVNLLFKELTKDVKAVDGKQLEEYYNQNSAQFINPEKIHAAHIVQQINPGSAKQVFNQFMDIRKKLLEGADFTEMATQHSNCNESGGDLGFFARGQMVEEFETIVFSMNEGEISPIFQTQFGYHIATVYKKQATTQKTFKEAKNDVAKMTESRDKNSCIGSWLINQRDSADIKIEE